MRSRIDCTRVQFFANGKPIRTPAVLIASMSPNVTISATSKSLLFKRIISCALKFVYSMIILSDNHWKQNEFKWEGTRRVKTWKMKKVKSIPVTGNEGPQGCETSRLQHFLWTVGSQMAVRLSALRSGHQESSLGVKGGRWRLVIIYIIIRMMTTCAVDSCRQYSACVCNHGMVYRPWVSLMEWCMIVG
jgi:hypothetical protein